MAGAPADPDGRGPYEHVGSVAAPLFGGFSITLIGVVAQASERFRWPASALLMLVLAALLFAECVVALYWLRSFDLARQSGADPHADAFATRWLERLGWAYDAAQICLFSGIAIMLIPDEGDAQPCVRWLAAAAALYALVRQLLWLVVLRRRYTRDQVLQARGLWRLLLLLTADPSLRR